MESSKGADREFVQSLAKGLSVIEAFGAGVPAMTLSEVARKVGLTPGSTRRVLLTLERLGYVASESGRYALLPQTLRLGYAYLSSLPLTTLVQPVLTRLTLEVDESCTLAMLDGSDVVFVARSAARRLKQDYMVIGGRLPAHATSFGKVLLAFLPARDCDRVLGTTDLPAVTARTITKQADLRQELAGIRERGWALNDQESMLNLRSIAVPIGSGAKPSTLR